MDSHDLYKEAIERRTELKGKKGDHPKPKRSCRKREKVIKERDSKHERPLRKGGVEKKR